MPPKKANPGKKAANSPKGVTTEDALKLYMDNKKETERELRHMREDQLKKLDKQELVELIKKEEVVREQKRLDGRLREEYSDDSGNSMEEESELEAQQAFEDIGNFIVAEEEDDKAKDKRLVAEEKKKKSSKVSQYFEEEAEEEKPKKKGKNSKKVIVEESEDEEEESEEKMPAKTKKIQKSEKKASEPVLTLTAEQLSQLISAKIKEMNIPQARQDAASAKLDNEGRCRDCMAIFKATPTSEGGKVSENKFSTRSDKEGKTYVKVYASIPCKECQLSLIRRLEKIVANLKTKVMTEEASLFEVMMLGYFNPILPYFAKDRSLEEIAKKKTEIFSFEEVSGEVKLRFALEGNVIGYSKGMSLIQHFDFDAESGWKVTQNTSECHGALSNFETIARKIFKEPEESSITKLICKALRKDFIPPKPLKIPTGQTISFDSLEF